MENLVALLPPSPAAWECLGHVMGWAGEKEGQDLEPPGWLAGDIAPRACLASEGLSALGAHLPHSLQAEVSAPA